ncbi:MAG: S-methyl-5-thioribose-1-phosphate isomerase [Deltaproteobacteria bacterium]|nr:MAG: S-methyl-5-thioribose-1-phosphate isomerase [Deltaproteobacteria bacterium]
MDSAIRTIFWKDDAVVMIDQKALPHEERHLKFTDYKDVIAAIKDLTVRGAPAIGVAAAMGIALGTLHLATSSKEDFKLSFHEICDQFSRTRPTARNLFWAIERMKKRFDEALSGSPDQIKRVLVDEAIRICGEDIAINREMGMQGRFLMEDGDKILTHCNAGALATAGYGTALGVIRAASEEGKRLHVFVNETRPVLQGARLTAWELKKDNIPATLITDSMAGFLMKQGKISKVIVGADRIAANGDVANKIGTYSLAVLAKEHNIPFYVAAPLSTIDISIKNGDEIPIEERNAEEITTIRGIRVAPEGVQVYNPAFDVTPNRYITAIVTEAGVVFPPYQEGIGKIARHLEK